MNINNYKKTQVDEIPEDWNLTSVGSLVSTISKTFDFSKCNEVVFLNTSDVLEGKVLLHDKVSKIGLPGQAKKSIQMGDILFSEIRPKNKRYAFVDFKADDYVVSTKLMVLRTNEKVITPKYLFIYLTSDSILDRLQLLAESRSGTFPQITFSEVSSLDITLPPLPTQNQIADFIESIDRKLDLNRRMNKKLEEIGQSFFKRWFMDFDFPNEDGKPYKSSGREMVKSELGNIPKGWEIKTIGDVCETVGGGTPSTKNGEYWDDGDINWATPSDITALKSPVIFNTGRKITEKGLSNSSAKLLPKGTLLLTSRATVGLLAISQIEISTNQGFISIICRDNPSNYFMFFELSRRQNEIINNASGSTFREISRTTFRGMNILIPPKKIHDSFTDIAASIFKQISFNSKNSEVLEKIRDSLLPRLMSGSLKI